MQIDVWSDIACPFCFIGKATLDKSLANFAHSDDVEVTYHSYILNPAAPVEPDYDLYDYLANKYQTSRDEAKAMNDQLTARAAEFGAKWHMDQTIPSNTRDAHRLLHYALAQGKQAELADRLFQAYFSEGRNVALPEVLAELATEVGLDGEQAREVLASDDYSDAVDSDIRAAAGFGITGVPFFVIDNKYGISGAQPESLFDEALQNAWSEAHPIQMVGAADSGDGCTDGSCAT